LDVLVTINHINANPGETSLPARQSSPPRFFDTNVDGLITAGDVLLVLNYLNSSVAGSGEGEASESEAEVAALSSSWAWAAGPTLPRSASSAPEAGRDQVLGTLAAAGVPDTEWYLADMELESPPSAHSFQTPLDEPELFDLEAVLEEIAAEIATA
jgi:hypothetical protein